ncbi:T9SS type A sorting domain-containing protein [Hymenobacter aquaticus]|uniref:T9SS type A sorting domain-containing protein n=1 Tax=Hymenobacter aquaticus TaxID=1867101 RepID=A0A4Z0PZ16_9BACT|nr:T9SS type A sorting domain-containing protein [Hymenobacter aquaticus]TGE22143.1 T9SS type A sorting domain-containing protein [Hymenobacter aquaticus]
MKSLHSLLLLLPLTLGLNGTLHAQPPSPCGTVAPNDMTSRDFATWDWETPRSGPAGSLAYCRTWAIRRTSQSDQSVGNPANAPWESATSGVMQQILINKDYTKAKGWVLLRENLGALVPIGTPYFVLYNKYTGMIRTFFYVDNSQGEYINGAVVTMSHSSVNQRSTGVMALRNDLLLAPDKYASRTDLKDEVFAYVTKLVSQQATWIMAEFSTAYDPNTGDSRFVGNTLEFAVQGIKESKMALKGDLNFSTTAQEGYAIAGKTSEVIQNETPPTSSNAASGTKKFFANGKKILGSVTKDQAVSFFEKISTKTTKLANNTKAQHPGRKAIFEGIASITSNSGGLLKTMKSVLEVAGTASAVFGAIGTVVGFLFPSDDAEAATSPGFIPTVSTGSISLSGTITTTYPLANVLIQLPGTQHNANGSTQPYYDCKLGIFSLKNTPVLNKRAWTCVVGEQTVYDPCYDMTAAGCQGGWVTQPAYDPLESYQIANDVIASYNKAAGLDLSSVEVALVARNTGPLYYAEGYYGTNNTDTRQIRDYMEDQFKSGVIELIRLDNNDSVHTFQTPFVSLSCAKNLSITVKPGSQVYLRVKAILQRSDRPNDTPPVFYVQDYAVDVNAGNAVATNPRFGTGNEPPFTNLATPLDGTKIDEDLSNNTGNATQFTSPFVFQAFNSVTAANNGWAPDGVDNSITINHPSTTTATKLLANNTVALGEGFSVTVGTNFVALPTLIEKLTCGPLPVEFSPVGSCPYNGNAYPRVALAAEQTKEVPLNDFTLYPNPSHGQVQLELNAAAGTETTVRVYNVYGSLVQDLRKLPRGQKQLSLSLEGQPAGIYIVQVTMGQKTVSKKVVLQ